MSRAAMALRQTELAEVLFRIEVGRSPLYNRPGMNHARARLSSLPSAQLSVFVTPAGSMLVTSS